MIYELRTYTVKVGTLPQVIKLFEERLEHRENYSPLAGCWYTDVGPLNQFVHLWGYESIQQRAEVRDAFSADPNWPPPIMDHLVDMRSEVIVPFPSVAGVAPGTFGPVYELRSYRLVPGAGSQLQEIWAPMLEARSRLSKPLLIGTTEFGVLNTLIHIWPYRSLAERAEVRAKAVETAVWPPPTAHLIQEMRNVIMLPTGFSPLQ